MSGEALPKLADTIRGLMAAEAALRSDAPSTETLDTIVSRGDFRPAEDEAIGFWFARFLSVRGSLWAVIDEVQAVLGDALDSMDEEDDLRYFLVGYAAVCLLIRLDRLVLFDLADHSIIQRKLNEPFPEYRIPRKQFTKIFSAFVDQANVLAIRDAIRFAKARRARFEALVGDPDVGFIVDALPDLETTLNPSVRSHLRRAWSYVSHKWRRRGVVSASNVMAAVLEGVGRTASEIADLKNKAVTEAIRCEVAGFLEPGDIIITRHAKALTNLFIPGFWPHSALYIGRRDQLDGLEIDRQPHIDALWKDDICVLEARKDGVRLRPLTDTLSVDKFVVLRPTLERGIVSQAIARALLHQGKLYNFDFDFFSSDRVVCTEVVYRAYDGLGGLAFPLSERAGRKTLSAEDLLDFGIDTGLFEPVAIYGVPGCEKAILFGDEVTETLQRTYREPHTPSATSTGQDGGDGHD
jgi:hypothetical protein